jgi:hypothetical protein
MLSGGTCKPLQLNLSSAVDRPGADARRRAPTATEGMWMVGAIEYGISRLSTFGSAVALVAGGALVAWVIGLLIVLRGSEPDERSEIIYAYAHCNPLVYLRRNTTPGGEGSALARAKRGTADSGSEVDHKGSA